MGFFEELKKFFLSCVNTVRNFFSKTINIIWKGISYAVNLVYDNGCLGIEFIVGKMKSAYDFIIDSIDQLRNAGVKGNLDNLKKELSKLQKENNLEVESFTYKLKGQDARTIFCN